jgi:hypothetical protein
MAVVLQVKSLLQRSWLVGAIVVLFSVPEHATAQRNPAAPAQKKEVANSTVTSVIAGETISERRIRLELNNPTRMDFEECPLDELVDYLKEFHGIEIQLDTAALDEVGIGADTPVTTRVRGVSLRSALRLMMKSIDATLTYTIENEVLMITTREAVEERPQSRIYNVKHLLSEDGSTKELIASLKAATNPFTWEEDTFNISPFRHVLVVTATEKNHEHVEQLLKSIQTTLNAKTPEAVPQNRTPAAPKLRATRPRPNED